MDEYIGIIKPFAGTYAPLGWVICDGSTLQIAQYTAVYAIIGTAFGGDGQTTFKVPDLRGVAPMGTSAQYDLGDRLGSETVTLNTANLANHSHSLTGGVQMMANADSSGGTDPSLSYPGPTEKNSYAATGDSPMGAMTNDLATSAMGSGVKMENRTPFTVVTYIMCVEGVFPPRN